MTADPYGGMSDADRARCVASDATLAGIIAGRRAAATELLATDPEPARQVREDWEPVRQAKDRDPYFRVPDETPPA